MATPNGTAPPPSAAARLRALLADSTSILVCPGVYDGFTARIALQHDFPCLYMTGAGTTMSRLGMPDLGLATFNDMRDHAAMIASLSPHTPLIADADTGYGGPLMVARTVAAYMAAGVAGLHLEDQVQAKRCGHLGGKELVPTSEFLARIRAAVAARAARPGQDIVIIARTDALQRLGYEHAVGRLKSAVEAGADVAFLEGFTSVEQGRQVCKDLAPTPVLLNMVPGGVTPDLTAEEAKELGFRLMIHPGLALGPVYEAVSKAMAQLKESGTVAPSKHGVRDIFEVCGLKECLAFDAAAGGVAYAKGV